MTNRERSGRGRCSRINHFRVGVLGFHGRTRDGDTRDIANRPPNGSRASFGKSVYAGEKQRGNKNSHFFVPANTSVPSAKCTAVAETRRVPSLAIKPSTVTTFPGLSDVLVQPRRIKPFGLPSCRSQLSTCPVLSVTSM